MKILNEEPVAATGALTLLVNAVIAMLVGFEIVHWDTTQIALVVALWNAIVAVLLQFVVRPKVTPQAHLAVVDPGLAHAPPDLPPVGGPDA